MGSFQGEEFAAVDAAGTGLPKDVSHVSCKLGVRLLRRRNQIAPISACDLASLQVPIPAVILFAGKPLIVVRSDFRRLRIDLALQEQGVDFQQLVRTPGRPLFHGQEVVSIEGGIFLQARIEGRTSNFSPHRVMERQAFTDPPHDFGKVLIGVFGQPAAHNCPALSMRATTLSACALAAILSFASAATLLRVDLANFAFVARRCFLSSSGMT